MTHAGAFAQNGSVDLIGAYDPDPGQLSRFCQEWVAKPSASVDELLALRPDIVSICSPNETHFDLFQKVLAAAPKAIICEKPMAMELADARAMVEQAQGSLLVVNYMRRWDSTLAAFKQRLSSELGKVQTGRVLYTKGVFHNASHGINLLQDWLGAVTDMRWVRRLEWQPNDPGGDFVLRFANGAEIFFQWADAEMYSVFEMELLTEKARIILPGGGSSILVHKRVASAIVPGSNTLEENPEKTNGTLSRVMGEVVTNVVNALQKNEKLKMPATDALATTEICVKLRESAK